MADEWTRDELQTLLDLQAADQVVKRVKHQLDHLEEQQRLDEAQAKVDAVEEEHAEKRVQWDLVQPKAKKLEDEIAMLEERKAADAQKLYGGEITNPRELQGLRADVESVDRRIAEHEDALLEVMEEAEAIQSEMDALMERSAEHQRTVAELEKARDVAAQGLLAELAEAEVARDAERDKLPDELLAVYDEAAEKFKGMSVGELREGMCTGCRMDLPRVDVSELRQGEMLTTCPECRRPLVVLD